MSNKVYDFLKWTLITFVPALILLITTLGSIYGFDTKIIVQTISAIATFAAALVGISSVNYYKKNKDNE